MSSLEKRERRDVVPRWRLSRSVSTELDALPKKIESVEILSGILKPAREVLDDFDATQKPMIAAEALSLAITEGSDDVARSAAKKLAKFDLSERPLLASLVDEIMRDGDAEKLNASAPLINSNERARALIKKHKSLVRSYPHSSLAWLDLAFAYSGNGQNAQAKTAVDTAIGIDRNHRGVVRASSRFYIHNGDFDKALWVIAGARDLKEDPWLMSAHLATSRAMGVRSDYISHGRRMFKSDKWRSDQLSELGAALATNEMEHGNRKLAQKIVERSVISPTENAVAQVAWLESVADANFNATALAAKLPNAWEARTFETYEAGEWRKSCEEAACWLLDQPFSSRPAAHGSFVAATFLEDYELSLRFSEAGFRANPKDLIVVNNYIVSLAELGRNTEARSIFDTHIASFADALPTIKATEGLIFYREGRIDEARASYDRAKAGFADKGDARSEMIAAVFQAREEQRLGNLINASELVSPLRAKIASISVPAEATTLKRIVKRIAGD